MTLALIKRYQGNASRFQQGLTFVLVNVAGFRSTEFAYKRRQAELREWGMTLKDVHPDKWARFKTMQ